MGLFIGDKPETKPSQESPCYVINMIFKNCMSNKHILEFGKELGKSNLAGMVFVKNKFGEIKMIKFGDIKYQDIKTKMDDKTSKLKLSKLPLPLDSLTYPKNDTLMKSAATNMLHELKGSNQKMGQVQFHIVKIYNFGYSINLFVGFLPTLAGEGGCRGPDLHQKPADQGQDPQHLPCHGGLGGLVSIGEGQELPRRSDKIT